MSRVNLELQMKFLSQLEEALDEALVRYADASEDKVEELDYMRQEVARARRIVGTRIDDPGASRPSKSSASQRRYDASVVAVGQASL